ncbi:Htur_1727 family rSAM-partnered candidate RiPP [Haloarchaeobius amylolyticus]|uniref:Htur_1727 family rSAM-partnered candidate RiPP n=1 Tax=Haloarchaeobius amylolyticus TaxID=1198296 RepID=A0ABD6BJ26_9EURY
MVENARRSPVASDERGNPTPQWEIFVREDADDSMHHVGSVAAASATEAHEHASRLFGWDAADLWLCPAEAVERYSTRGLTNAVDDRTDEAGVANDADEKPRIDEATDGNPEVRDA